MMKALIQFVIEFDIAESYLYGTAKGDKGSFAINLQGGNTLLVLPQELLNDLPYVTRAKVHIRSESESLSVDAKLSSGRDMIEIYDDEMLEKLADSREVVLQIEII